MATDTRRRVKLYALNAERQWDDRGTGHVSSNYVDRLKGISLLVRAESDGSLLLESKIQPDTAYQKQQDTLIVWSEGDNFDLALSFQEKIGCDEIWEKICQVQGKDPSVEVTQEIVEESEDERFEDMSDTAPPIELPPCELGRLEDISETIQNCLTTPLRKEKLSMALENENYIKKLLNLFNVCEDLDNTEGLHHLFEIFKNIFLLNKNALFEIMFGEDTIFDVVGCLEYDPSAAQPKKHRQYLKQWAKFREAVPIKNPELLAKIHQTFRVQYIQDIILPTPSVFVEDNMLNTLSSFIFFNKVEIVTLIQEDERFLVDMFHLLTDSNTPDIKRRDIVLFLKEFCNYAQNLQPQGKDSFYKTLTCLGILQALEITLVMNDQKTKSASIDILTAIVEFSPLVVRNYTLQQVNRTEGERMLLNVAIEQMLKDAEPELGVAVQLMGIVKMLLEPENMLTEKGDFLNFFYKYSIQTLIAPLLLNTIADRPQNEDYQTAQLLGIVLDILSFCVEHHTYHIKNFIIQKDLLKRILVLMKSTHTFLVLGALRLLRKIVALKDEFYNRHIVKSNLFTPVVDAFIRNNGRYNLLESAILELFEFVKLEDIKTLCVYFVENFSKIFDEIEYVQTFKYLKSRYDQYQDKLKDHDKLTLDPGIPIIRTRFRREPRQMDEEEEMWFNEDEDFAEDLDSYNTVMKSVSEKNGPQTSPLQANQLQQKSPNLLNVSLQQSNQNDVGLNNSNINGTLNATSTATATATATSTTISSTDNVGNNDDTNIGINTNENSNEQTPVYAAALLLQQQNLSTFQQQLNASQLLLEQKQREEAKKQSEISELQQQLAAVGQQHQHQQELAAAAAAAAAAAVASTQQETTEAVSSSPPTSATSATAASSPSYFSSVSSNSISSNSPVSNALISSPPSTPLKTESKTIPPTEELSSIITPTVTNTPAPLIETAAVTAAAVVASQLLTITPSEAVAAVAAAVANVTGNSANSSTTPATNLNCDGNVNSEIPLTCVNDDVDISKITKNVDDDTNEICKADSETTAIISAESILKKGLVDYESDSGEDEDYDDDEEDLPQQQKKPRLV